MKFVFISFFGIVLSFFQRNHNIPKQGEFIESMMNAIDKDRLG